MHFYKSQLMSSGRFASMEGGTGETPIPTRRGRKRAAEKEDDLDLTTWSLQRLKQHCSHLGIKGLSNGSKPACIEGILKKMASTFPSPSPSGLTTVSVEMSSFIPHTSRCSQ